MRAVTIIFKKPATVDQIKAVIDLIKPTNRFKGALLSNKVVTGVVVPKDYRKLSLLPEHYNTIDDIASSTQNQTYEQRVFQFWNDSDTHKNTVKMIELLK